MEEDGENGMIRSTELGGKERQVGGFKIKKTNKRSQKNVVENRNKRHKMEREVEKTEGSSIKVGGRFKKREVKRTEN